MPRARSFSVRGAQPLRSVWNWWARITTGALPFVPGRVSVPLRAKPSALVRAISVVAGAAANVGARGAARIRAARGASRRTVRMGTSEWEHLTISDDAAIMLAEMH